MHYVGRSLIIIDFNHFHTATLGRLVTGVRHTIWLRSNNVNADIISAYRDLWCPGSADIEMCKSPYYLIIIENYPGVVSL